MRTSAHIRLTYAIAHAYISAKSHHSCTGVFVRKLLHHMGMTIRIVNLLPYEQVLVRMLVIQKVRFMLVYVLVMRVQEFNSVTSPLITLQILGYVQLFQAKSDEQSEKKKK